MAATLRAIAQPKPTPAPNFDREVLEPLRISQAKETEAKAEQARLAALEAARQAEVTKAEQVATQQAASIPAASAAPTAAPATGSLATWLLRLRTCEAGGNYAENTGNSFYGAFQFSNSTWNHWNTGYARADLAPASVQDATIIKNTNASTGGLATQNPGCFRSQGLSAFPPQS